MSDKLFIDRPPRIQPELPQGEFTIPAPPTQEQREQSVLQLLLPALAVLGYVVFLVIGGTRTPWLVFPMLLIASASSAVAWMTNQRNRREWETQKQLYRERLSQIRQTLAQQQNQQRQFYNHTHPNPTQTVYIARAAYKYARDERYTNPPRLWERRPSDHDFGTLRLGIGSRPSTVQYALSQSNTLDDPLYQEAERIAAESTYLSDVPITVRLRPAIEDEQVAHALGMAGENTQWVYRSAWSLITNYAALHAPSDARLFILGTEQAQRQWQWATELPHCEAQNDMTTCFEDAADIAAPKEESNVYYFLKGVRQLLDKRRQLLDERENDPASVRHPFLLVVVDLLSAPLPNSRLSDLEADAAISTLMEEGDKLGAAVLFLVNHTGKIPSGCQAILEIHRASPQEPVTFRYAETGLNATRYLGLADYQQQQEELTNFAKMIGFLRVRKRYGQDMPFPLKLFELLPNVSTMDDLRDFVKRQWRESQLADVAEWLQFPVGVLSGGDRRTLKLSADVDGVHGLIAGSTGSGKSELLMTMILSLAIHYDPTILNFVLIDFKGGGAFKPLETLPHVVSVVTNLDEPSVDRIFASIRAELDRRARVNTYTNINDIVEYRERGLHLPDENGRYGQPINVKDRQLQTAPYPHLFIIIDEFAEMMQMNQQAYKPQLESITRLGRALGVTLILAAQKPTGVTDQMRANIKFRIALRVEDRDDSMEVLRRPDAAYLPNGIPGRGYLQVGFDNLELMQVAWSGGEYAGARKDVIWLGPVDGATEGGGISSAEPPKLYEEVVRALNQLAEANTLPQRRPWPDFLPKRMSLQTHVDTSYLEDEFNLVETDDTTEQRTVPLNALVSGWLAEERREWPRMDWEKAAMRAVIGLVDNPARSEQRPLYLDLRRGHAVVFGASGWGKTNFLRTALTTLLATHSPDVLQVYVLDFGSRQFAIFRDLPHVGAVITPDESERTRRLLRKLDATLEERRQLLGETDHGDIYSYNADPEFRPLPAVLVLIDNFAGFRDNFDTLLPPLISLVRESRAYGVHFVISAELPHVISARLYSVLTERFALTLAVSTEYTNIVGRNVTTHVELPGRGVTRQGRQVLEFQTALPVGTKTDLDDERENEKLRQFVAALGRGARYRSIAPPIKTLSRRIQLKTLLADTPRRSDIAPALGVDDLNLHSWHLDLKKQGPHLVIAGSPSTGKTTLLRTLILSLAATHPPSEVTIAIVDFQRNLTSYDGELMLDDLPHVVDVVPNIDRFPAFVKQLNTACRQMREKKGPQRIFVIIDNYERIDQDLQDHNKGLFVSLSELAREFGPEGLHFILAGTPEVTRIVGNRFIRQIYSSRFGIGLDREALEKLNGRVPQALLQDELPIGRGYVVKSGKSTVVQFATPYTADEAIATSLDAWVRRLQAGEAASWGTPTDQTTPEPAAEVKYDLDDLRRKIEAFSGFSIELSADDIISMAKTLGMLEE